MLVPAFARMTNREAVLVAVGPDSGGYKSVIERMILRHGVGERVIFTGILTGADRVAALVDADLFSLPSEHENFGISIVEALAAGTPVVISDKCGIHAEVAQAHVGAVVPMDVGRLAAELDRWTTDDAMRFSAAARARPFVWQTYNWTEIANRWSSHYLRLAAGRRR
jgi:glycosyltransferase involved in cell wall biosynthesis